VSAGETVDLGSGLANAADVALCRDAWLSATGSVPPEAEEMLTRNECYFALLLLLEAMYGRPLNRWRITFADNGSAYRSTVWITDRSGQARVYEGRDDASMLQSLLAVIDSVTFDISAVASRPG
jgi:hypothetical protein